MGGDYYDFLDLGRERLGLVIGDISGKGIAAALLMANLQANLRSQFATALDEPQRFLCSVNRLFYENTIESAYATLFFADYDTAARRRHECILTHITWRTARIPSPMMKRPPRPYASSIQPRACHTYRYE